MWATWAGGVLLSPPLAAQARPSTDVWIIPLTQAGTSVSFGEPRNATHRVGYDNQPSFTPRGDAVLYTVIGEDAQADIWRFAIPSGRPVQLTHTTESEYSPTVTPDGRWFSVIRVEADSTQRLWKFPMDGQGAPALVLENVKPVGYHVWAGDHTLGLFVLGSPATLQLADDRTGTSEVIARNIGRGLVKVPGRDAFTFQQQARDSAAWITELNVSTKAMRRIAPLPEGADYHAWAPNGALLSAAGSRLYVWKDGGWSVGADLSRWGVKHISRIAVSPRGDWVAFVAEDATAP
jgi:hypothetical protein